MKRCKRDWLQNCRTLLKEHQFLLKPTIILFFVYLFAISALLRANVYYIDDLGRSCWGYAFWENYARHLSVLFARFLHGDTYLTDISPLPQVLAVFLMALASSMVIYILSEKKEFSFRSIVAVMPLALSPYFLECFSYKYDAPYMAFSVLAAVFPLLFARKSWKVFVPVTFVSVLCLCLTYQVSAGIFPMLVATVCIRRWVRKEDILQIVRFAAIAAVTYVAAILIFNKFFIIKEYEGFSTGIAPLNRMIPSAIYFYKQYAKTFLADFKLEWLILVAVICLSFIYVTVRSTRQYPVLTFLLTFPALLGLFALSFGVYPFLEEPGFDPRCMYGIGCFIAFLGVYVATADIRFFPAELSCLLLSWMFFVFAFTYGNALYTQKEYTDFRLEMVVEDLADSGLLSTEGTKAVRITNTIGYSPHIRNMPDDYQILTRLIPVTFRDSSWYWGSFQLLYYYELHNLVSTDSDEVFSMDLPVIAENCYHTIRGNEDYIWINLYS